MQKILSKFGEFERNSILLMISSVFAGAFSYAFQILLGNVLTVADYGTVNILLTEIAMISIVNAPICLYASRNVAIERDRSEEEMEKLLAMIWEITFIVGFITLFSFFILFKLGKVNSSLDNKEFVYFAFVLFTNILYNILLYIVQGYKNYKIYSLVSILYTLIKFVIAFILYKWANGIVQFLQSLLITNIVCIVVLLYPNRNYKLLKKYRWQKLSDFFSKLAYFYSWTFVLQLVLGFLVNGGDIVLVKMAFSAEQSGIYSVSATLCKVAIFGVTPIMTIMFPEVAGHVENQKSNLRLLKKTLLYGCGVAGAYLFLLNIFGQNIVDLLYGEKYSEAVEMLKSTSLYIIAIIFLNIVSQYCIALGRIKNLTIGMVVMLGIIIFFSLQHLNLVNMIALLGGTILLFSIIFLAVLFRGAKEVEGEYE